MNLLEVLVGSSAIQQKIHIEISQGHFQKMLECCQQYRKMVYQSRTLTEDFDSIILHLGVP